MTQANLNATDRLSFAKRWAEIANNQFNEATGPQVDDTVFNLSAAEDYLNASIAASKAAYKTARDQEPVLKHLRAMRRISQEMDTWLTVAVASLALTWWGAVAYFVYRAIRHLR